LQRTEIAEPAGAPVTESLRTLANVAKDVNV
jgi:hypothetical protein